MATIQSLVGLLLVVAATGLRKRRRVETSQGIVPQIRDFPACHMSNSTCAIGALSGATLVFTDRDDSRCWNGDPWAFLVRPGNPKKLMMYFTAGGGCWEHPDVGGGNATAEACADNLEKGVRNTAYGFGVFNFGHSFNKFKDYTLVSLPYCTGGAFVGNVKRQVESGGYQYGYNNADIAQAWAAENIGGQRLESFVIMGSSGGAMGIQAWSYALLSTFKYEKASVLIDSYVGVFPENTQGAVLKTWGACDTPLWKSFPENIRRDCNNGNGNIYDILDHTMAKFKTVAFAHIQPKGDAVQRSFYALIGRSYAEKPNIVFSAHKLYKKSNEIMQRYNKHGNYLVYYVNRPLHCFFPFPFWYTTVPVGPAGPGKRLAQWAADVVDHKLAYSQCNGFRRRNGWPGNAYCDRELFPKTLQLGR